EGGAVNAGQGLAHSPEAAPNRLQRAGNFAHRGADPDGPERVLQQIPLARAGAVHQRVERLLHRRRIPARPDLLQASDLGVAHGGVVNLADLDRPLPLTPTPLPLSTGGEGLLAPLAPVLRGEGLG